MSELNNSIERVLLSEEQISKRVHELGAQISKDYQGKNLLLVAILKGSVVFISDLMRAIDINCKIDFMRTSSYGSGAASSGNVKIDLDLGKSIKGYDVLIIEDILDSGNTLYCLKNMLMARNPDSLKICTFLDKPSRRTADITGDYCGYQIEDEFVVGYGLDYAEEFRNLPYIGILKRSVYEK